MWAAQVALAASVPVIIIATGRIGWYPTVVGAAVLIIGSGFAWSRRRMIVQSVRAATGRQDGLYALPALDQIQHGHEAGDADEEERDEGRN